MAKASKNDKSILNDLLKAGMIKQALPRAVDPKASQIAAINARKKELNHASI